jgi:hypothetical protein
MSSDDYRKLNRLKELLLVAIRSLKILWRFIEKYFLSLEDEPIYCTQRIVRSDFDREEMLE